MKSQRSKRLERLADAEPSFYCYAPNRELNPNAGPDRSGLGVVFDCPIHDDCWISVPFANPLDGAGAFESNVKGWHRIGDTFENLTLSPSIKVLGGKDGCEWHGFIRDGRFEHCGDSQ